MVSGLNGEKVEVLRKIALGLCEDMQCRNTAWPKLDCVKPVLAQSINTYGHVFLYVSKVSLPDTFYFKTRDRRAKILGFIEEDDARFIQSIVLTITGIKFPYHYDFDKLSDNRIGHILS